MPLLLRAPLFEIICSRVGSVPSGRRCCSLSLRGSGPLVSGGLGYRSAKLVELGWRARALSWA
eukprot:1463936-Alexandrium_andersonii.AAC.1